MATVTPITHVFSEINEGKYKSVKHYELIEVNNGTTQLTELINISKNQNCAQSMPTYWLQIRKDNKWIKPYYTGLFKTWYPNIFKGDKDHKKHLLIFKFSRDCKTLIIDFYQDFYTNDLSKVLPKSNQ